MFSGFLQPVFSYSHMGGFGEIKWFGRMTNGGDVG